VAGVWDRYQTLILMLLGAAGAAALVGLALLALVHTLGGTLWGSSRRLLDLVQWAVVALQTVSQAAPASSASLPPALGALFRGLATLRVEGVLLPSGCLGEYAFQTEVGVMGTALGCVLVIAGVWACAARMPSPGCALWAAASCARRCCSTPSLPATAWPSCIACQPRSRRLVWRVWTGVRR